MNMAKSKEEKLKEKKKEEYQERINNIKKFLLIVVGYGLIINYPLYIIFSLDFNLFTFPAWGIVYYFISDEFPEWFRRVIGRG